jgi:predicted RNase H-like HicB family nuclease
MSRAQLSVVVRPIAALGWEAKPMLTDYINAGMRHATYEKLADGTYYGEIPSTPGVWANAPTLEACREELRSVLEGWILLGLRRGHALPVIDGIELTPALTSA